MTITKNISKWPKQFLSPTVMLVIFIAGVALGTVLSSSLIILGVASSLAVLAIFSIIIEKRFFFALLLVFSLSFLYAGFFKYLYSSSLPAGCELVGVDSDVRSAGQGIRFGVADQSSRRAIIETNSNLNFGYGDKLKLCFDSSQIKNQPALSHYFLSQYKSDQMIRNPQIEFKEKGRGITRFLYDLADKFSQKITSLFPGDEGLLGKGLLLGGTQGFSSSFKDHLKTSGTSHLVAVSGYNVSILTIVLFGLIRSAVSRRAAFVVSALVLIGFCLMTGASASVLRASIMGGLFLLSKAIGRKSGDLHFLALAAFLMILVNPYVIFDLGFQLSFAATAGLVLLQLPIQTLLKAIFSLRWLEVPLQAFSETISAQIFAFPVLLSGFGAVSAVAPLTNVLILPLVPLGMLLVALSLLGTLILPQLGYFLAGLTMPLLQYFVAVINFFGGLRFAKVAASGVNWIWVILLYVIIIGLATLTRRYVKSKMANGKGKYGSF